MISNSDNPVESTTLSFFCHFSLWFGVIFATPLFIGLHNPEDLVFSLAALAGWALPACLAISWLSWKTGGGSDSRRQWWISRIMLAAAIVLAIQGNVIHDLFYYGAFNGQRVDFRSNGWKFWAEWLGWLTAFPLTFWLLTRISRLPSWLPALPVLSFSFLLFPALLLPADEGPAAVPEQEVDPSVFAFSSVSNLIHLLPDGFQGDVVRQVLEENPELAEKFRGFTLFTDNVGLYQGTAPALYTILTGEPFEFEKGFSYKWVMPEIKAKTYQNRLVEQGYQLDYVPISGFICPKAANSCHVRPFNDMKARGYFRHRAQGTSYSIRLIADLSLFRLVPMFLKERIHNEGRWFLADTTLDGSSPWPDPIIREWTDRLYVVDDRPVYKWYHYVGTHIPAKWDDECRLLSTDSKERDDYKAQAFCVLNSIGTLLERLDQAGIYDQTAFLISGDHGHNVTPDDLSAKPLNSDLYIGLIGSGRPALLVKQKNNNEPLNFSSLPTSMEDVAPTALQLAGIASDRRSAFDTPAEQDRVRLYRPYSIPDFYSGNPIPYVEYRVGQPASDGQQWAVSNIQRYDEIPTGYDPVNRPNAKGYVLGARLHKSVGNNKASWITGRQLAFVIELPKPPAKNNLELTLHLPEWIPEQSFTVQLNNGPAWRSPMVKPVEEFWQSFSIPLAADQQVEGKNFVSVEFERLHNPPDSDRWEAAAFIKSITVSGSAQAD